MIPRVLLADASADAVSGARTAGLVGRGTRGNGGGRDRTERLVGAGGGGGGSAGGLGWKLSTESVSGNLNLKTHAKFCTG